MMTLKAAITLLNRVAKGEPTARIEDKRAASALSAKLQALGELDADLDRLTLAKPAASKPVPNVPGPALEVDPLSDAIADPLGERLQVAGTDSDAFEAALAALLTDKSVTVARLRAITAAYTDTPVPARTTRGEAERLIRQAFARRQWQAEAYRRIDSLNAAK